MEINLEYKYDFTNNEEVDQVYGLIKSICQKFPNATWGRKGNGHVVTI
ncbi:hypothetical protein J4226_02145 [Candidatus Pacearchaeota archaeon]|nr:hypothetical protein [Candidatus Pacearchaeota archaeon]